MVAQRSTRTAEYRGQVMHFYEPTDGQMAVLAQQLRHMNRGVRSDQLSDAVNATGVMMTVLEKLVVDDADQELLADDLINGELDVPTLVSLILGGDGSVDGEVADAPPTTITSRQLAPVRRVRPGDRHR